MRRWLLPLNIHYDWSTRKEELEYGSYIFPLIDYFVTAIYVTSYFSIIKLYFLQNLNIRLALFFRVGCVYNVLLILQRNLHRICYSE